MQFNSFMNIRTIAGKKHRGKTTARGSAEENARFPLWIFFSAGFSFIQRRSRGVGVFR
jgi:hypothetical protein